MPDLEADPIDLFDRFAEAGAADPVAARWWQDVLRRHRCARGEASIEAIAGVPQSPAGWRLARSAESLRRAHELLEGDDERRIVDLAAALDVFATRGSYRHWARAGGPPAGASPLQQAMFAAIDCRAGKPPSESTIRRHISPRNETEPPAGSRP